MAHLRIETVEINRLAIISNNFIGYSPHISLQTLITSHRTKVQGRQDLEEALGVVDALIIEAARYFDAIESDLASANVDLVKRGMTMFEVILG